MLLRVSNVFRKAFGREKRLLGTQSSPLQNDSTKYVDPEQVIEQLNYLENELCVLVDQEDKVIGTASKKDCHKVSPDGTVLLHRAFSLFLFNGRGDIYIQKRSNKKVQMHGYYSNTICSHPLFINSKVEPIKSAVRRKLHHELNVPLDQIDSRQMNLMTRIHYYDPFDGVWGEHEMDYILVMQADLDIDPNPDEIEEFHCVPRNEFHDFMESLKGPVTPWFDMIRHTRLQFWWDNLSRLKEIATPEKIEKL